MARPLTLRLTSVATGCIRLDIQAYETMFMTPMSVFDETVHVFVH
jgi:hypothetical protein